MPRVASPGALPSGPLPPGSQPSLVEKSFFFQLNGPTKAYKIRPWCTQHAHLEVPPVPREERTTVVTETSFLFFPQMLQVGPNFWGGHLKNPWSGGYRAGMGRPVICSMAGLYPRPSRASGAFLASSQSVPLPLSQPLAGGSKARTSISNSAADLVVMQMRDRFLL